MGLRSSILLDREGSGFSIRRSWDFGVFQNLASTVAQVFENLDIISREQQPDEKNPEISTNEYPEI